jgi:hypothetical protein
MGRSSPAARPSGRSARRATWHPPERNRTPLAVRSASSVRGVRPRSSAPACCRPRRVPMAARRACRRRCGPTDARPRPRTHVVRRGRTAAHQRSRPRHEEAASEGRWTDGSRRRPVSSDRRRPGCGRHWAYGRTAAHRRWPGRSTPRAPKAFRRRRLGQWTACGPKDAHRSWLGRWCPLVARPRGEPTDAWSGRRRKDVRLRPPGWAGKPEAGWSLQRRWRDGQPWRDPIRPRRSASAKPRATRSPDGAARCGSRFRADSPCTSHRLGRAARGDRSY